MRRIIVVCQVFYPDTTSTSQLFQTLLQHLSSNGWEVQVLCGFPSTTSCRHTPHKEKWKGITIKRCGFRMPLKQNLFYRFLSYLSFLTNVTLRLIFSPKGSYWLGVTNPPFNAHILAFCAWLRNCKFYYFLLDLHPEGLIAIDRYPITKCFIRLWLFLNKISYRRATKLFVLGRDMTKLLIRNYKLDIDCITYMPHWSAVEFPTPISIRDSKFISEWNLQEKFIVQYSGNMGLWHDIETLVRVAHSFLDDTDIQFVFIGDGIRKHAAMDLSRNIGTKNIVWRDFVPLEDLAESLATCHISLVSLRKGLEGIAVPCKLYGILASCRTVVAQVPETSEIAMTIRDNDCGIVVPPDNPNLLRDSIVRLKNNPNLLETLATNALSAYRNNYTTRAAAKTLQQNLLR